MNVRKPVDYNAMFKALDNLMAAALPKMQLYREIGRLVNGRPEKGAAVAANVTILEGCESLEERVWYIRAVRRSGWTKAKLLEKIHDGAYLEVSLDLAAEECNTKFLSKLGLV